MKTRILLVRDSESCKKAKEILLSAQVPFDELLAHPVWTEIEYPIPTFFTDRKIYKGLEEIESAPIELGYGGPN